MTDQELNRAVQYVTASTSHSRELVDKILRTGFAEMTALAVHATCRFNRADLVGYICQWTMKQTGQPEPLVREILDCAGRWLDDMSRTIPPRESGERNVPGDEDAGTGAAS
ncbi:hypothetical protein [Nitrospira sp. Nam80]|jgi:hypothetical protein